MLQERELPEHTQDPMTAIKPVLNRPEICAGGCRFFGETDNMSGGPVVTFDNRETIYEKDYPARYSYKVIEGAVRTFRVLTDGRRQILDIFLPGDTFSLELAEIHVATAEAIGQAKLLRCPRSCIRRQCVQPDIYDSLMQLVNGYLCAAQDHVTMLGHLAAKERVACFVLRVTRGSVQHANKTYLLPYCRQDIADYLGLTIETVSRTLTDLKISGVIALPARNCVTVRDFDALKRAAGGAC
ncbi:MAG: helix-turn-helix domain-containing protein [Alphaproteobacteria bacterium]|nr:helix-turn-helix domain-containing protein [Alphaproteobacteria bacterium]MDE2493674.1 helix-turn-helix domain-containing protein [Alphaproteobacteria bacterium]